MCPPGDHGHFPLYIVPVGIHWAPIIHYRPPFFPEGTRTFYISIIGSPPSNPTVEWRRVGPDNDDEESGSFQGSTQYTLPPTLRPFTILARASEQVTVKVTQDVPLPRRAAQLLNRFAFRLGLYPG